jgi:hypothetical protein
MTIYDLRNAINEQLSLFRPGSFSFWGHWFGRPYDNYHRIVGAEPLDGTLAIYLDGAETLIVDAPEDWSLDDGRFLIGDAARVRFQWFEYGLLPSPETLRFVEYRKIGGELNFATDFQPEYRPELDGSLPAVQLHSRA